VKRNFFALAWAAAQLCAVGGATAQVTVYDVATNLVTIPSVSVGPSTFTQVTLLNVGNFTFTLQGATEQKPAAPGVANYDLASNVLTIPAVKLGTDTYLDVTLLNIGNYVFSLQGATLLPQATADEIKSFMASFDALWASAVPASGALANALNDACYRSNGRTKAWQVADFDENPATTRASEAYRIGARRINIQVLALRTLGNADGSTRREVDVQYDIAYQDGSTANAAVETLISGQFSRVTRMQQRPDRHGLALLWQPAAGGLLAAAAHHARAALLDHHRPAAQPSRALPARHPRQRHRPDGHSQVRRGQRPGACGHRQWGECALVLEDGFAVPDARGAGAGRQGRQLHQLAG